VQFKNGTILGLQGLSINYAADDTVSVHLGVDYKLNDRWTLQAGYVYDPSPFDDSHVDILSYSSDRHIISGGASYDGRDSKTGRGWKFAGGFQLIPYKDRDIKAGESQNLGGLSSAAFSAPGVVTFVPNNGDFSYGGFLWTAGLSASYHF
jgi:long-subunit fatty acid transport protein